MNNKEIKVLMGEITKLRFEVRYDFIGFEDDIFLSVGRRNYEGLKVSEIQINFLINLKNKLIRYKRNKDAQANLPKLQ